MAIDCPCHPGVATVGDEFTHCPVCWDLRCGFCGAAFDSPVALIEHETIEDDRP